MHAALASSPRALFLAGLAQGELRYQVDEQAGCALFPPRAVGPSGRADRLHWHASAGMGTLCSFTEIVREGRMRNIVLVDLDEGFRMMATLPHAEPGALRIGMRVRARIEPWNDIHRVVFEVAP